MCSVIFEQTNAELYASEEALLVLVCPQSFEMVVTISILSFVNSYDLVRREILAL